MNRRNFGVIPHATRIEQAARISTAYLPVEGRCREPSPWVSPLVSFFVGLLFIAVIAAIAGL